MSNFDAQSLAKMLRHRSDLLAQGVLLQDLPHELRDSELCDKYKITQAELLYRIEGKVKV